MTYYTEKGSEIWAYDNMDFIGKLYPEKGYYVWDPSLGRLAWKYGGSTSNFFTIEQAKRYIEDPHQVEQDFVGLPNLQRLSCYTCGETCLKQPGMIYSVWLKGFLDKHPSTFVIKE